MMGRMRKPSIGRQKIEMKKIESSDALQVCFSKRRAGLFKKANELSVLCGAEIAVVVFSPAGKPFSYGHPSVDSVVDRYLSGIGRSRTVDSDRWWAGDIIQMHAEMTNMLDSSKKLKARLEAEMESRRWDGNVEGLGFEDLETLRRALEDLKKKVINHEIGIVRQQFVPKPEPINFAPPNYNYSNDIASYGGFGMISSNGFSMPPPAHGSYNDHGYNNPLAAAGGFNYGFGL